MADEEPTKRGRGRPTKFTPEHIEPLLRAIRLGATYEHACMAAGISYDIFNEWKNGRGYSKETTAEQKADFLDRLKKAEGQMVTDQLATIQQAAQSGNWQAAAWKLERRHPKIYGRQVHEHTGPDGSALTVVIRGRDPEPESPILDEDSDDQDDDDPDDADE